MIMEITQHLHTFIGLLLLIMLVEAHQFNPDAIEGSVMCKERERQALLNVKNELIDNYHYLSSWGSEDDKRECCKWRGITCSNRTGHVTKLDLHFTERYVSYLVDQSYSPLRGKISYSLLELRHLAYLDLSSNDFGGSHFPHNNVSFTKLRYLNLSKANLDGPILFMLRNLSKLQFLDLGFNFLNDIGDVEWLFGLSSLSYIDLTFNHLISPNNWLQIPNKLLHLQSLRIPYCFSWNWIPFNPSPINSSSSLTTIYLSGNNLVIPSIYPWLSNITHKIKDLHLSRNKLQGSTLSVFSDMVFLETLSLYNTTLSGDIPESFGNMSRLNLLNLSRNNFSIQLTDLIQSLSGSTQKSLQHLYLDENQITGSLPDLTGFSSLRSLYLEENRLNGTVDKSIGQLSNLEHLYLGWNSLNGLISEDHLSNLSNLRELVLSGNSFTWNISLNWVPPFHLSFINLQSCKMGPHFPKWLQSQKNYSRLDISDAGISGAIPDWFWGLSFEIYHLNLSHNNLNGPVKNMSLTFSAFPAIDLSFNRLHGPLPLLLFPSEKASPVAGFASYNSSSRTIIGPLVYLDLSSNLFSGVIPDCFMHVQGLMYMNLANNNLSGQIPRSIGSLRKLETLDLKNNKLSGVLPLSLKNGTKLRFLDLSNNHFSGSIPTWIGESLSSLQFLSLKSNNFHGSIPLQVCQLTNVQILDLSLNNINGTIPHCLKNLKAMSNRNSTETISHDYLLVESGFVLYFMGPSNLYIDKALVLWKGKNYICDKNLGRFRIIDLSSNNLGGEIPMELLSLPELNQLNLSNNMLTGAIPPGIGCLKQLESLDLSRNQLSGKLPASMTSLNFLNTLNLSYNDFSGRIPSSTQLQSFNSSVYIGNHALCGLPLTNKCQEDSMIQVPECSTDSQQNQDDGDDEFRKSLFSGMGLGFTVGLWGVFGALVLKRSWRHAYFLLLDSLADWVYVTIAVYGRRLQQNPVARIHPLF